MTRLVAYGAAGFAAIAPLHLPYCQPDFRDLATLGGEAEPLPLLPIVRWNRARGRSRSPETARRRIRDSPVRGVRDPRPPGQSSRAARSRAPDPRWGGARAHPAPAAPQGPRDVDALAPLLRSTVLPFHTHGPEAHGHVTAEDARPRPSPVSPSAPSMKTRDPRPALRGAARAARAPPGRPHGAPLPGREEEPRQLPGRRRRQRHARRLRPHRRASRSATTTRPCWTPGASGGSTGRPATGPRSGSRRRPSGSTLVERTLMKIAPPGSPRLVTVTTGAEAVENAIKAAFVRHARRRRGGAAPSADDLAACMQNDQPGIERVQGPLVRGRLPRPDARRALAHPQQADPQARLPGVRLADGPVPGESVPARRPTPRRTARRGARRSRRVDDGVRRAAGRGRGADRRADPGRGRRPPREPGVLPRAPGAVLGARASRSSSTRSRPASARPAASGRTSAWELAEPPDIVTFSKKLQLGGYYCREEFAPPEPFRHLQHVPRRSASRRAARGDPRVIEKDRLLENVKLTVGAPGGSRGAPEPSSGAPVGGTSGRHVRRDRHARRGHPGAPARCSSGSAASRSGARARGASVSGRR